MVALSDAFSNIKSMLKRSNIESYSFEAACIFEHVFGFNYRDYGMRGLATLNATNKHMEQLSAIVNRRISGEPLQYILGEWEFYGLRFIVGKGVLIPRPDTETLVDVVIKKLSDVKSPHIIDLCSGSGCIPISIEKNVSAQKLYAFEISNDAIKYLKENISLHNSKTEIVCADVLDTELPPKYLDIDMITANPPYLTSSDMDDLQTEVAQEPTISLFGGEDGLDFYRAISKNWHQSLKVGGILAFEVGLGQFLDVSQILSNNGFDKIEVIPDLAGIERVVLGIKL